MSYKIPYDIINPEHIKNYQFNFNFEGTSLNFRGNFTNVVPVINSNSLVDLPVSQGDSSVLRTLIGVNGGVDATKNTDSLFFNIQNQVDSNAATVTYFTLTSAGALTMDAANTPPGSYVLTIRLRDATDSSNNEIKYDLKKTQGRRTNSQKV